MSVAIPVRTQGVPLNSFVSGAMSVLLALLVATGVGLAAGVGPLASQAAAHRVAAAGLLALSAARVAMFYMSGAYRADGAGWLRGVGLLVLLLALHVTGGALLTGEPGAEGRAHMGAAAGSLAPSWSIVLMAHALLLAPIAALLVLRAPAISPRTAPRIAAAALLVAMIPAMALAATAPAPIPEIDGVEAARTPWAVRALEPLEGWLGMRGALAVAGCAVVALALLPLAEKGVPVRRTLVRTMLLVMLAAVLVLGVAAAFLSPAHHLEVPA